MSKLGEDVTETLEVVPRRWKLTHTVRKRFSCRDGDKISHSPTPFHVVPRGCLLRPRPLIIKDGIGCGLTAGDDDTGEVGRIEERGRCDAPKRRKEASLSQQNPEQGMKYPSHPRRNYPHLISRSPGGNRRWPISVSNSPRDDPEAFDFVGRGYVGLDGAPTPTGRAAILQELSVDVGRARDGQCVVWSAASCTYLLRDGTTRDGRQPPTGTLVADDYEPDLPPLRVEDVWTLRLPPGCLRSHLCLKRQGDLVEIGGGEPMVVADLIDGPLPGRPDPFALRRADDGSWLLPFVHRGVRVTAVRNGAVLLGPVQMVRDDALRIMHDPWPARVEEACQDLAGRALPRVTLDAAWRAIDPINAEMNHVGVLEEA